MMSAVVVKVGGDGGLVAAGTVHGDGGRQAQGGAFTSKAIEIQLVVAGNQTIVVRTIHTKGSRKTTRKT